MSLPLSRNTTYAASSQVKSADLNDIQDQIVALWAGPPRTDVISAFDAYIGWDVPVTGPGWKDIGAIGVLEAVDNAYVQFGITLPLGRQITAVRVRVRSHNTANLTCTLYTAIDGTPTSRGAATAGIGAGVVYKTLTITPGSPVVVDDALDQQYYLRCVAAAAGPGLLYAEIDSMAAP